MTLEKQIAEDYGMVLKEAQSMGCNKIKALYNIPLDNMKAIVNALEEVEQYRAIGTVEECMVAVEKQKEKKPIFTEDKKFAICPSCNGEGLFDNQKYCDNCGQKILWEVE